MIGSFDAGGWGRFFQLHCVHSWREFSGVIGRVVDEGIQGGRIGHDAAGSGMGI